MNKNAAAPEFDQYASNYEEYLQHGLSLTGEGWDYFAAGRVSWLRSQLDRRGLSPASCLDFGCGTGASCGYLHRALGLRSYLGFDPSSASIAQAVQATSWQGASFTHAADGIAPESMDLAFCNGVFHHIPPAQRMDALRLIWRSLKPGGVFAFWENNRWNPVVHYLMSKVPFDQDARMLFPSQARRLLRAGGFKVLSTDYLFIFPRSLSFLRPLEPALCKLPLGGQYLVLSRKE
ncbi:class I SAM-dependent methyltransferase [Prosthecobacter sp.]|uniref:class I SAM-dependent methyltransferase n=1 Tax=Prosthecobacter sp. TaxID=1965333 RepID=UPI0037842D2E